MSAGRVGAIVLAGGRSSRFGGDKLEVAVADRRLLDRAIDAVRAAADDIVVVLGPDDAERRVPPDVRIARDTSPFEGPLVGVVTGLEAIAAEVERVLVVGGDMPTLLPSVLDLLVAALDEPALADAAILETDDRVQALPMALRRAPALGHGRPLLGGGERRLRALPAALGAAVVAASVWRSLDPDGVTLRDIDRPTDIRTDV